MSLKVTNETNEKLKFHKKHARTHTHTHTRTQNTNYAILRLVCKSKILPKTWQNEWHIGRRL